MGQEKASQAWDVNLTDQQFKTAFYKYGKKYRIIFE